MKYNAFFKVMMAAIFAMASVNTFAQGHGRREMHVGGNGIHMMANNNHGYNNDRHMGGAHFNNAPQHGYIHHAAPAPHHANHMAAPVPRFDRHGYLPGWEGRVRYLNGRYGYLRGNSWYWYDTYFAPDYYFAHPHTHFHAHLLSPEGRAAVGAVVGAVAVAGLVSALMH